MTIEEAYDVLMDTTCTISGKHARPQQKVQPQPHRPVLERVERAGRVERVERSDDEAPTEPPAETQSTAPAPAPATLSTSTHSSHSQTSKGAPFRLPSLPFYIHLTLFFSSRF